MYPHEWTDRNITAAPGGRYDVMPLLGDRGPVPCAVPRLAPPWPDRLSMIGHSAPFGAVDGGGVPSAHAIAMKRLD